MEKCKIFIGMLVILAFLAFAGISFAMNVDIDPEGLSQKNISNVDCGSSYSGSSSQFRFTNNGRGGILCWYYTSDDDSKIKLTNACVRPQVSFSYDALLAMPISGNKTVDVRLECFEFLNSTNDTCQDDYNYDDAKANANNCANADGSDCLGNILAARTFGLHCDKLDFGFSPLIPSIDLLGGRSASVPMNLTNKMNFTITCDSPIGNLMPNQSSFAYKLGVTAPSAGFGSTTKAAAVTCTWAGGTSLTKTAEVAINYRPDPCSYDLSVAYDKFIAAGKKLSSISTNASLVSEASLHLSTAENAINDAQYLCTQGQTDKVLQQTSLAANETQDALDLIAFIEGPTVPLNVTNLSTSNSTNQPAVSNQNVTIIKTMPNYSNAPLKGEFILLAGVAVLIIVVLVILIFWKK